MIGRRSFMALLGLAPVAASTAPVAPKGIEPRPMPSAGLIGMSSASKPYRFTVLEAYKAGLLSRQEFEQAALSEYGYPRPRQELDDDLASYRSFSAVAKHRIQRQRMVDRAVSTLENGTIFERIGTWTRVL